MPSPIAHGAVGVLIAGLSGLLPGRLRGLRIRQFLPGLCVIVLSLAPDMDAVPGLFTGDLGRYHNDVFSSLFMGLAAALVVFLIAWALKATRPRFWFGITLACYWGHLLMDFCSPSRGLKLFWPFRHERMASPVILFEGFHWSQGPLSPVHVWTVVTEIVFAVFVVSFGLVIRNWRTGRASGRQRVICIFSGLVLAGFVTYMNLR